MPILEEVTIGVKWRFFQLLFEGADGLICSWDWQDVVLDWERGANGF